MAGSGETLSYGELEEGSARLARVLHEHGPAPGRRDRAARRQRPARCSRCTGPRCARGLYITAVNHHLHRRRGRLHRATTAAPRRWSSSAALAALVEALGRRCPRSRLRLAFGGAVPGFADYDDAAADGARRAAGRPAARRRHALLLGHHRPAQGHPAAAAADADRRARRPLRRGLRRRCTASAPDTVYLSPAPLYHAAPLRFARRDPGARRHGRGDGALRRRGALAAIERYRVTHSQWVPTMFVRMLKLPEEVAGAYDVSHAAGRRPRRGAVPGRGQAGDDRLVGPDRCTSTTRPPRRRRHLRRLRRSGWSTPARSAAPRSATSRICDDDRRRAAGRRGRHDLLRARRRAVHLPQRPGEDRAPRGTPSTRLGAPPATSATSTRRAASTSPTARRS